MPSINLGNVVGLIKQTTAPIKTYVIWAKILDILFPDIVELYIYDANLLAWIPLQEGYLKVTKDYTDFSAAALSNNLSLMSLPAGYKFLNLVIKHSTPISGGTITAAGVTVGVVGELDKYTPFEPLDVFSAVSDTNFSDENVNTIENWGTSTDIRTELTVTGDNLDQAVAGEIDFYILIKRVKQ